MSLIDNKEATLIKEFSDLHSIETMEYVQSAFVKYDTLQWKNACVSEYDFSSVTELGTLIESMWTDFKEEDRKKIAKICSVAAYKNRDVYKSNDTIATYNYVF